jgi:hypothetical protein
MNRALLLTAALITIGLGGCVGVPGSGYTVVPAAGPMVQVLPAQAVPVAPVVNVVPVAPVTLAPQPIMPAPAPPAVLPPAPPPATALSAPSAPVPLQPYRRRSPGGP